ncbi:MAG: type II secretion system F family protein [Spirochaeta sp.]
MSPYTLYPAAETEHGMRNEAQRPPRLRPRNLLELTRSLSLLSSCGITIKEALEISKGFVPASSQALVQGLQQGLSRGEQLSDLMDTCPEIFPAMYRGLIRIGEETGRVSNVLQELSGYLAEHNRIKDKLIGALIYPAAVLMAAAVGLFLLAYVGLPRLEVLFLQLGQAQTATDILNRFHVSLLIIGGIILPFPVIGFIWIFRRHFPDAVRRRIEAVGLRIPFTGTLLLYSNLLRWSFAMETLSACGLTIDQALLRSCETMEMLILREEVIRIRNRVVRGDPLSECIGDGYIPPYVRKWVAVGEQSGRIHEIFRQLRRFYTDETQKRAQICMNSAEPILLSLVGILLITVIRIGIIPLFQLYGEVV